MIVAGIWPEHSQAAIFPQRPDSSEREKNCPGQPSERRHPPSPSKFPRAPVDRHLEGPLRAINISIFSVRVLGPLCLIDRR